MLANVLHQLDIGQGNVVQQLTVTVPCAFPILRKWCGGSLGERN